MEAKAWSHNRRAAEPFVRGLSTIGITGSSALSWLRDRGLGYRTGEFYEDWRRYSAMTEQQAVIEALPRDDFIPRTFVTESPLTHANRYRYDYLTVFRNKATGELLDPVKRSMSWDEYLTPGDAEDMFDTEPDWGISEPDLEYVGSSLVNILHRKGDPFP